MVTALTLGIKVSVDSVFRKDLSHTDRGLYFFSYCVIIENVNDYDVQLKSRYWMIFDSLNPPKEIKGEGVVGEQPILTSGRQYTYMSGCDLSSEMGYMKGIYSFEKVDDSTPFEVEIPEFHLITQAKLN